LKELDEEDLFKVDLIRLMGGISASPMKSIIDVEARADTFALAFSEA
jgi:hypothetical protein